MLTKDGIYSRRLNTEEQSNDDKVFSPKKSLGGSLVVGLWAVNTSRRMTVLLQSVS